VKALVPLAAACFLLAACSGERQATAPTPRLPARVADVLARQSRAVAARLDRGESCAARHVFGQLRAFAHGDTAAAMPRPLRRRVLAAVDDLGARLPACIPPAAKQEEGAHDHGPPGRGKGKGRDHGKKEKGED
jgi:hypothetical protein